MTIATPWQARAVGGQSVPLDVDEARAFLEMIAAPEGACQLEQIPGPRATLPWSDLTGLVEAAKGLTDGKWLYVTLNPVKVGLQRSARIEDVLRRLWLMVDVDALRPDTSVMATADEHAAAFRAAQKVRDHLAGLGWPPGLLVDTGNGFSSLYRIDLPNTTAARALCGNALRALALTFDALRAEGAAIDAGTFKANQDCKLPGSMARKGKDTPERPHRKVCLVEAPFGPGELVPVPTELLMKLAAPLAGDHPPPDDLRPRQPEPPRPVNPWKARAAGDAEGRGPLPYAAKVLREECARLAATPEGGRNEQAYKSAAAVGNYIEAGRMDPGQCRAALLAAALSSGLPEREAGPVIDRGLKDGREAPKAIPESNGHRPGKKTLLEAAEEASKITADDVATIHDLIRAGSEVSWLWPEWIQLGVLTAIAAPGGTGKTRFCADLLRRIARGEPWPDGQAIALPVDTLALWVVSDNHHDEMVTLTQAFGIVDSVRINASKADPYGGVSLDEPADLMALEARIKAVRPALVMVDTVGNATDKNLSRQEDAKAFYFPLQVIARKYRCAILCLTHLNAGGQFLGRRVLEKVRVAIRIEQPEEDNPKRRLEVIKSNSKRPEALGMTMGDAGNEYDDSPPDRPTEAAGPKTGIPAKVSEALDWLKAWLGSGSKRVGNTISEAEKHGFSKGTLYRAVGLLGAETVETEGIKWWCLKSIDEVPL